MFLYKIESKLIISRSRTVWKIKLRSFKKSFLALKFTKYFTLSPSDISTGKEKTSNQKLKIKNKQKKRELEILFLIFLKNIFLDLVLPFKPYPECRRIMLMFMSVIFIFRIRNSQSRIKFCQNAIHSGPEVAVHFFFSLSLSLSL